MIFLTRDAIIFKECKEIKKKGETAMSIKTSPRATIFACCTGYAVQSVVVNYTPLLFLTFHTSLGISFSRLTLLVTVNFAVQLLTDFLSARVVARFGFRKSLVAAHAFAALGLALMAFLPSLLSPFVGILLSTCIFAVGGGILEVLVSPLCEACPVKNKTALMSFLHSFFCWGVVLCALFSTLFFVFVGTDKWQLLTLLWALFPVLNGILFCFVPIYENEKTDIDATAFKGLFRKKEFWGMMLFMLASGASELSVSQWASAFTESALGVSKTVGDLIGVCGFAVMMGLARTLYAKLSTRLPIEKAMILCAALCTVGYLFIGLSSSAALGLIGCAVCGFGVGIFWPATYSLASRRIRGGTLMFSLLAFAGDLGCSVGPTVVGTVADLFSGDLKRGILLATVFPLILFIGYILLYVFDCKKAKKETD